MTGTHDDRGRRCGPFGYATSICRDLDRSARAYQQLLGYQPTGENTRHTACPGRCDLLLPPDRTVGGVHLVERREAGTAAPWRVPGGAALEIVVRDADTVASHAETVDGFVVVGGPRPAGANRRLRVVHVRGPDGEVLYLTRILPADRPHILPARPRALVGRVYALVLAVGDLDRAQARLRDMLTGSTISDRRAALATSALVRGDPDGSSYRISSTSIAGGGIVELDEMPDLGPVPVTPSAGPVSARFLGPRRPWTLPLDLVTPPSEEGSP